MLSLTDYLIIWCSVGIPWCAATIYLGKKLEALATRIDRRNQSNACGKKACNKKTKGLLRAND